MTSIIQSKLDELLHAYEKKGYSLASSLRPGLTDEEIKARSVWFPAEIPPELIELYKWRNGQFKDPWEEEFPFWFRDNAFISIEKANDAYESIVKIFAEDNAPERDGIDLLKCFPFAEFNGECYLLPCSFQKIDKNHARPVINQNGEIFYFSIETMLDTIIEWVSSTEYRMFEPFPSEVEKAIWNKHNPNIFSR